MDFSEDLGGLIDTVAMVRPILPLRCFYFATVRTRAKTRSNNECRRGREAEGRGKKKKSISRKFFRVVTDDCDVFLLFEDGVVEWGGGLDKKNVIIQSSLSALERPVILKHGELWLENIGQLCPFVSPGLLNES